MNAIMERYILQPSQDVNFWVCTDQESGLVCKFEQGNFNENQQFSVLEDRTLNVMWLAALTREMGDWLHDHHYEKVFNT